jgi:rare lipoprotein A (peptidoglycan hydrolase)
MRLIFVLLILLVSTNWVHGQELTKGGLASYYGKQFHGRKTASGERFNMNSFTSAHRTLPFNTLLRVTNVKNGKSIVVRVNDRGPMKKTRIIDLSLAAAKEIGLVQSGVGKVKIELVDPTEVEGSYRLLTECCFSEIEEIAALAGYNLYGKRNRTDGASIEKTPIDYVFCDKYASEFLLRTKISPIFNSSAAVVVNKSKSRRRN